MPETGTELGKLFIEIRLQRDRLVREYNFLKREAQQRGEISGKEFSKGFTSGFKTIAKSAAAFLGLTTAAIGLQQAIKKVTGTFIDFDRGMRNVNSILNLGEQEFKALGSEVLALQKEIGVKDINDLTMALYQAVSAGVEAGDSINFLRTALKAAKAGLATNEEAVDALTTVINAYKFSIEDAGKASDILFQTVKLGKTTFSQLAGALSTVLPIASASGVEFEQVAASMASLTKQGVETSVAATQTRAAIVGLNKVLGDGWAEALSFQEAVKQVAEQANYSQTALSDMIGRIEGVNAILSLTGKSAETAANDLRAMEGSLGAMNQAFEQQTRGVGERWSRFVAGITADLTRMVEAFADFVLPEIDITTQFEQVRKEAAAQSIAFEKLFSQYLQLKSSTRDTRAEQELYLETIQELNKNYGAYLKNIDLENDGLERTRSALQNARIELDKYLKAKVETAAIAGLEQEFIKFGLLVDDLTKDRIKLQAEFDAARKSMEFRGVKYQFIEDLEEAIRVAAQTAEELLPQLTEQFEKEKIRLQKQIEERRKILMGLVTRAPQIAEFDAGKTTDAVKELTKEQIEAYEKYYDILGFHAADYLEYRKKLIDQELEYFRKSIGSTVDLEEFKIQRIRELNKDLRQFLEKEPKETSRFIVPEVDTEFPEMAPPGYLEDVDFTGLTSELEKVSEAIEQQGEVWEFIKEPYLSYFDVVMAGQYALEAGFRGLFSDIRIQTDRTMSALEKAFAAMANAFIAEVNRMIAKWLAFQAIKAGLKIITGGLAAEGGEFVASPQGLQKMQTGGSFVVPPGFPSDTYPVMVSSGERVTVDRGIGGSGQNLEELSMAVNNLAASMKLQQEMLIKAELQGQISGRDIQLSYDKAKKVETRIR